MCVLLCANSKVRKWFDIPQALAHRQIIQLCPSNGDNVMVNESHQVEAAQCSRGETVKLDNAKQQRVMKRSAWRQAYCRYHMQGARGSDRLAGWTAAPASSREWHKALEAIAETWGRLLSLVGLRR